MLKFCFLKSQRLLTSLEFKKVITTPSFKLTNEAFVVYVSLDHLAENYPKLGLAITKKHIRKAVQRNLIKRLVRESFRLQALTFPASIVVMSRSHLLDLNKALVREKIDNLWIQLEKKFPKHSVSVLSV